MEKLNLYERLLKNKNKLKVQTISLLLATTSLITTGCGKTEKPNVDNPQPGVVDVIDNDDNVVEEEMVPLTIENLDSEAERITNSMVEKGAEVSFEDVRTVLLHLNKDSFSDKEYYSLFDSSEYEEEPINDFFNNIMYCNTRSVYLGSTDGLINLKDFCRSEDGYKVIGKLEDYALTIAKAVITDSKDMDSEIASSLKPIYELLDEKEQIQIGDEIFKLEDLDDGTKALIMYSYLNTYNYVHNLCKSDKLTDETNSICNNTMTLTKVICCEATDNIRNNIYNSEFSKTK